MGTTLLQDQIGGLQVLHQDQWVDVPPMPGAFIINIGDLMQVNSSLLLTVLIKEKITVFILVALYLSHL